MINTIILGHALNVLPRNRRGQFIKGISYNPKGTFKKGYTYRKPKLYWNEDWLKGEYKNKTAKQIADEQGCHENNIFYFLHKFKIIIHSMEEIRANKYWGLKGKQNGMYGKTGKLNPNWNGGNSPERQSSYARSAWKELAKAILKRDNYTCKDCGTKHTKGIKLIVHHIKQWSKYPELRFEPFNLITLCEECHKKTYKRNKND